MTDYFQWMSECSNLDTNKATKTVRYNGPVTLNIMQTDLAGAVMGEISPYPKVLKVINEK